MKTEKVSPEEVVKMVELYEKYGSFAAVAKEVGRSATTVSKYLHNTIIIEKTIVQKKKKKK